MPVGHAVTATIFMFYPLYIFVDISIVVVEKMDLKQIITRALSQFKSHVTLIQLMHFLSCIEKD
ncbi:hypothetical protein THOE12_50372 [Vibrio rotiferianus]|nr:hypothetical protein THOE12_50372 [Vibrio rotiferianus]